jgi:hypothetical protein
MTAGLNPAAGSEITLRQRINPLSSGAVIARPPDSGQKAESSTRHAILINH